VRATRLLLGSSLKKFIRDDRGASSVEFALLSVPAIIVIIAVVQTVLLARATIVLEHAAYAAARSALVHRCRPISPMTGDENLFSSASEIWGAFNCDETEADARILGAAQLAVIPISTSNGNSRRRQSSCRHPDAAVAFIIGAGVREGLRDAIDEQACYAFEPGNVQVEVDWNTLPSGLSVVSALPTLSATVTYRMPVLIPVRGIFSDGRREDGTHYRVIEATVNLL